MERWGTVRQAKKVGKPGGPRQVELEQVELKLTTSPAHPFTPFLLADSFSGGGTVDFQEFVGGLSAFSSKGGREEKLHCTSPPVLALPSFLKPAELTVRGTALL